MNKAGDLYKAACNNKEDFPHPLVKYNLYGVNAPGSETTKSRISGRFPIAAASVRYPSVNIFLPSIEGKQKIQ